jgi:hypothetical protein
MDSPSCPPLAYFARLGGAGGSAASCSSSTSSMFYAQEQRPGVSATVERASSHLAPSRLLQWPASRSPSCSPFYHSVNIAAGATLSCMS